MRRALALALAVTSFGCGGPSASAIDGGAIDAADALDVDTLADAGDALDAGRCDMFPEADQLTIDLRVSLANFETNLVRLDAVTVAGAGHVCVVRGPPSIQTIAMIDLVEGSIYELRFTAVGYVPFTFHIEVGPGGNTTGTSPGLGPEGVVMVRGTVLGPAIESAGPGTARESPAWGLRPGTDELFFVSNNGWRVARRGAGGITVSAIDVALASAAPHYPPRFTPDGQLAFLPTGTGDQCTAISAADGTTIATGLDRAFCMLGSSSPSFAARARIGVVLDFATSDAVVFSWTETSYREERRIPYALHPQLVLDAMGAHLLREDDFSHPVVVDLATGTDAMPTQAPDTILGSSARVLGARGDYTVHIDRAVTNLPRCPGGCAITLEPIGGALRPVTTDARFWAASPIADALAYVTPTGELHRYDVTTSTDTTLAVDPFDSARVQLSGDALVLSGTTGVQVVAISTGEVRLSVPGTFPLTSFAGIEPVPDSAPVVPDGVLLLRPCIEADCPAIVVDLHDYTSTTAHDHPFRGGQRAWYEDASRWRGAGPATDATGRWSFFGGSDVRMEPVTGSVDGARFPCAPFFWGDQWICAE